MPFGRNLAEIVSRGDEVTQDAIQIYKVTSTNATVRGKDAVSLKGVSGGVKGQKTKVPKNEFNLYWSSLE